MDKIVAFFKAHGGYARMKDLKNSSVQTRDIYRLLQQGVIEKVKPGLYRLTKMPLVESMPISYLDICQAIPAGVICLLSALDFYDLITFNPSEVYVALPHKAKPPKIDYPPMHTFFFRQRFYELGIETIKTEHGEIRIYNKEKSICDIFRYRNKLGEDLALEALKSYLAHQDRNIVKLYLYAEKCHVKTVLRPYMKAIAS